MSAQSRAIKEYVGISQWYDPEVFDKVAPNAPELFASEVAELVMKMMRDLTHEDVDFSTFSVVSSVGPDSLLAVKVRVGVR